MAHSQQGRHTEQQQEPAGPAATGTQQVAAQHGAHGQSVASWTAVGVIMLGALIMAVSVVAESVWLFVVGVVVVVLGAVAGKVLSAMGFGVSGKPSH
jgi:sterol desaturase/sphingolipid hydroxylase (fatty acid hydroxylase superfamily)